ncbi:unnamed protein product [Peniophora sp. CBMAI 1063]|nr:unnamed protein product [Peniophora sp. CBMAI 1063]
MLARLSFIAAVLSTLFLFTTAAPASLVAELERRQGALTSADGIIGDVLNVTSGLRRDTAELSAKPRQLDSITGLVSSLLGGVAGGSPPSTPPASSSPMLRRQGLLTSVDTLLADAEAVGGLVRRGEVEFKLENGDKSVDMKYDLDKINDEEEDCDEDKEDAGDAKESHQPEADEDEDEDDEDEDEDDEDESDEEDEWTK